MYMYIVENIELDLINYKGSKSIQPLLMYVDETDAILVLKRLDENTGNDGWEEILSVLMHDNDGHTKIVSVDPTPLNVKVIHNISIPDVSFKCSNITIEN